MLCGEGVGGGRGEERPGSRGREWGASREGGGEVEAADKMMGWVRDCPMKEGEVGGVERDAKRGKGGGGEGEVAEDMKKRQVEMPWNEISRIRWLPCLYVNAIEGKCIGMDVFVFYLEIFTYPKTHKRTEAREGGHVKAEKNWKERKKENTKERRRTTTKEKTRDKPHDEKEEEKGEWRNPRILNPRPCGQWQEGVPVDCIICVIRITCVSNFHIELITGLSLFCGLVSNRGRSDSGLRNLSK